MRGCNFDRLLELVNKQLDLDGQLEVYDHLDRCDICRDAVCQLSRDRDQAVFFSRAQLENIGPPAFCGRAGVMTNALAGTAAAV